MNDKSDGEERSRIGKWFAEFSRIKDAQRDRAEDFNAGLRKLDEDLADALKFLDHIEEGFQLWVTLSHDPAAGHSANRGSGRAERRARAVRYLLRNHRQSLVARHAAERATLEENGRTLLAGMKFELEISREIHAELKDVI